MSEHHHHTWPRRRDVTHRVACPFCDSLHQADLVEEGQAACCQECGTVLYRNRHNSLARTVAFALTALAFFLLMLFFPFLSLDAQGNTVVVSVPDAVLRLWEEGGKLVSFSVALFVVIIPLIQLLSLVAICLPLLFKCALPGSRSILRFFQWLEDWAMVEVFFLGAIVSLLKLTKLAAVDLGIGFWATAALMVGLAGAIGGIDRTEIWDRLETAKGLGRRAS